MSFKSQRVDPAYLHQNRPKRTLRPIHYNRNWCFIPHSQHQGRYQKMIPAFFHFKPKSPIDNKVIIHRKARSYRSSVCVNDTIFALILTIFLGKLSLLRCVERLDAQRLTSYPPHFAGDGFFLRTVYHKSVGGTNTFYIRGL